MFLSMLMVVVMGSLTCFLCMLAAVYLWGFIEKSIPFMPIDPIRRGEARGLVRGAREPVLARHQYPFRVTVLRSKRRDNG